MQLLENRNPSLFLNQEEASAHGLVPPGGGELELSTDSSNKH